MSSYSSLVLTIIAALSALILSGCQGSSVMPLRSGPVDDDPNPQTAPLVSISFDGFDPETTTLRFSEGRTVEFELDTLDSQITSASLRQASGPTVNFGEMRVGGDTSDNGDLLVGDGQNDVEFTLQDVEGPRRAVFRRNSSVRVQFVMPSVERRTRMTFRFESQSRTQSRSRTILVINEDDGIAITLTGHVSKGLISNTPLRVFSVDGFIPDLLGRRQITEPVQVDETGRYSLTLLPSIDFEELVLLEVEADGADMVCDAPQGCRVAAFGETFEVDDEIDLRAFIPVPAFGESRVVNLNILTTLSARSAAELSAAFERVAPEDVIRAQAETARIFGLPNQDFTTLPFVDVTRPITETSETAIRAAMIGAGVLGAAFAASDPDDNDDYLEEIEDFIDDYEDAEVDCLDAPSQTTFSIEDVMAFALEASRINGSAATQRFFEIRLLGLRNGTVTCDFTPRVPE